MKTRLHRGQKSAGSLKVGARRLQSLQQPIVHHATVFDSGGDQIILVGGAQQVGGDAHSDVWSYSVSDNEWYSLPSLPSPRSESSMIVSEGHLYVWGSEMVRFLIGFCDFPMLKLPLLSSSFQFVPSTGGSCRSVCHKL